MKSRLRCKSEAYRHCTWGVFLSATKCVICSHCSAWPSIPHAAAWFESRQCPDTHSAFKTRMPCSVLPTKMLLATRASAGSGPCLQPRVYHRRQKLRLNVLPATLEGLEQTRPRGSIWRPIFLTEALYSRIWRAERAWLIAFAV